MVPAANPTRPQARRPARADLAAGQRNGPRLHKRKLTLAEAAGQWVAAKREIDKQKALLDEAAPVLLDHFERTGRGSYKDLIGWTWAGGGLVLDTAKVKAFLGERLGEFQTRSRRARSLRLLK